MTQITLQPNNITFNARPSQTVLEAAIEAGLAIPYGCRNGACGSCKGKLLSGKVIHDDYQRSAMTEVELAAGNALFCCARALDDIVIECREAVTGGVKPRILPARLHQKNLLNHDVMQLYLQLPASEKLQFKAGQYIEFILKDGARRAFSIANAPHDDAFIELHLRYVKGGQFTEFVFNELVDKAIMRIEAPLGSFYVRDTAKPMIFVAGGTGFAPIKGMLEDLIFNQNQREIVLYRGAKSLDDLYMHDMCEKWAEMLPNFQYVPVLSGENWAGRTGLVHQAVLDDFADLSGFEAYVCGAPGMVDVAQQTFTAQGLPPEAFFADAFTFAPQKPA